MGGAVAISLQIDGTVGADDVQGIVQSEELTCVVEPQGRIGNLYHVTWSGQLDPGSTPTVSGDWDCTAASSECTATFTGEPIERRCAVARTT